MNGLDSTIEAGFGGDTRRFHLRLREIRALQEKTDAGPQELLNRYQDGRWRVDDVREVIRQGLIGADMKVDEADKLMRTEFDGLPLLQFKELAVLIIMAALIGNPNEPVPDLPAKKPEGETDSPDTNSTSDGSTTTPPNSDSHLNKLDA